MVVWCIAVYRVSFPLGLHSDCILLEINGELICLFFTLCYYIILMLRPPETTTAADNQWCSVYVPILYPTHLSVQSRCSALLITEKQTNHIQIWKRATAASYPITDVMCLWSNSNIYKSLNVLILLQIYFELFIINWCFLSLKMFPWHFSWMVKLWFSDIELANVLFRLPYFGPCV